MTQLRRLVQRYTSQRISDGGDLPNVLKLLQCKLYGLLTVIQQVFQSTAWFSPYPKTIVVANIHTLPERSDGKRSKTHLPMSIQQLFRSYTLSSIFHKDQNVPVVVQNFIPHFFHHYESNNDFLISYHKRSPEAVEEKGWNVRRKALRRTQLACHIS